ncbi:MAG: RNA-binding protein [Crocinitomicaceae bacterium]|nr:RNA-binding protein [Crocinitomicaceae bacterium]
MTIYITNIHPGISERKLVRIFKKFGEVSSVVLAAATKPGLTGNFGYVEMENELQALNAILNLNRSTLKKCVISVSPAIILNKKTGQI